MALNQAVSALGVTGSIGVNTHIDFNNFGYQNLAGTIAAIKYLGVRHLRDCPGNDNDINSWGAITAATGAKWLAFIGETSLNGAAGQLNRMPAMAAAGLLEMIEGPNEWDDAYPKSQGVNLPMAVSFQSTQVLPLGRSLGLPVVNISFGAGWFAPLYEGDYVTVGDMSMDADFANPHTYPLPGQNNEGAILRLNDLAHRACPGKPIICTEIGWPDSQYPSQRDEARFALFAMFDGLNLGIVRTYYYAEYNDGSGKFGLMNQDGTPKQAGAAIHNVMAIFADTAAGTPGTLDFTITGTGVNDRSLLAQKSTGEYELVLWNERDVGHNVTISLPQAAAVINLYDPLVGSTAILSQPNASSITVGMSDHPLIVEIIPAVFIPPPPPPPPPPLLVQTPLSVSLVPASVSLDDQTTIGRTVATATVLASDGLPFTGPISVDAPFTVVGDLIVLASALPTGPVTLNPVVTASENGVAVTAPLAVTVTHVAPPPPPPPPPQTPTLVGLSVNAVSLVDITPVGTIVSAVTVQTSDALPFVGSLSVDAPFAISADGHVVLAAALPTGPVTINPAVHATENGVTVSAPLAVTVTHVAPPPPPPPTWNPAWVAPASLAAHAGVVLGPQLGISVTDPLAVGHAGSMALNLHVTKGTLSAKTATGALLPGSGTAKLPTYFGSFAVINAVLATLTYTSATAGSDILSLDIFDQGGIEAKKSVPITIS